MKTLFTLLVLALAAPAAAQNPPYLAIRAEGFVSEQEFAAVNTFKGVFGQSEQSFWGAGVSVTQEDRFYVDFTASRFKKTGQRAFRASTGEVFQLGIPLRATITPIELTGGYRFHFKGMARLVPYLGGGIGFFKYQETSDFAADGENVDTRHVGGIFEGGLEVRLGRWLGVGADAHFTHVPGILGQGGISKDANENDLGGISARLKIIIGL